MFLAIQEGLKRRVDTSLPEEISFKEIETLSVIALQIKGMTGLQDIDLNNPLIIKKLSELNPNSDLFQTLVKIACDNLHFTSLGNNVHNNSYFMKLTSNQVTSLELRGILRACEQAHLTTITIGEYFDLVANQEGENLNPSEDIEP